MVKKLKRIQTIKNILAMNIVTWLRGILPLLLLMVTMLTTLTACSNYTTFSSGMNELDFTFEYPKPWNISIIEKYADVAYINITGPTSENESAIKVSVDVWLGLESRDEQEAYKIVTGHISSNSWQRNFNLIRQDTIILDGIKGYQVECTYDFDQYFMRPIEEGRYIPTRELDITFPRGGRVYEIRISASQNEWNVWENDIQHVLDTFKWK